MRRRFARPYALWFAALCWSVRAIAVDPVAAPVPPPPPAAAAVTAEPRPDVALPGLALNSSERQWLAEHPVVKVLSDAGSPPYDFLSAGGEHLGLYPDYLAELARATGLRFVWSEQTRRDQLADVAARGDGQLLIAFGVPVAAPGLVPLQRTAAYDYPVLVRRREGGGFADAASGQQRVSLVRAYGPAQDYAQRLSARQFLGSDGFEQALVDVAVGRTDLSVQSLAVAEFLIRERGLTNLEIAGPYSASQDSALHWSVPAAAAPLAGILEKAWDSLPPERHRLLRERWLARPAMPEAEPVLPLALGVGERGVLQYVAATLLLVALLLLLWGLFSWLRSRPVALPPGSRAQKIERVLDASPALIFEMEQGRDGAVVIRYASTEARRLFAIDLTDETLPLDAFLRLIYPEDQAKVLAAIEKSGAEREEQVQDYRVISPQGTRWVRSIVRPIEEDGPNRVWSGVTVDISAQKWAEARQEQTEQRLREVTDNVPGVVFQMQRDLGGNYALSFASPRMSAIRGVNFDDFNRDGDALFSSIHDEDRGYIRGLIEQSAIKLEPFEGEYRVRMPDGHLEWLLVTAIPHRARDGVVVWNGYLSNISKLKAAQTGLAASQRFLQDLTDGVPGFIFQVQRNHAEAPYRFTFISAGVVNTHGVTAAETLADGRRLMDSVEAEEAARIKAAIDRSYATLTPYRVDYRLRLPNGLTAWMRTQAAPVRNPDGSVLWNGMTFNISEEKLREMQARRAEERLSKLTNALPGVVFQLANTPGGEWVYTYISDGARQLHQIEPDAVMRDASLLHDMLFAEDWRRLEMALSESEHNGIEVIRECRTRRGDGALRWLRILARPQGQDGDSFVWNGFTQDITDEKEAGMQAEALQRRLREVTENVPCTVYQLQRDFEDELSMRFVSENVYALIGITREELMTDIHVLINRLHAEDLPILMDALETARQQQRPVFFDFRIRDTAEIQRWIRGSVSTPRIEDGSMVWNGAWLDITDIKELEADLASASRVADGANRLKSEFLATMSHEIRTPMNAIIGLGLLMQQTPLSSTQAGYLQKINSASQSLLGILNDILDHSKIEAGKLTVERTEFDLNTVLDGLCAVTHLKAVEKDLELRFEVPPGLPMRLLGDPLRLGQVLLNLTSNAIKFSDHGTVVVRVEEIGRADGELRLQFEVSDEGIGLSEKQIEGLFQSFAQGDASTTRKYGGTGLGLSIARNLIRLMKGEITVQSILGEGSVFRFEIGVGLPAEAQPRYDLPRDLHGLNALVVDDNLETRAATEGWLAAFGCKVEGVDNGLAALELIQQRARENRGFVLVVLDWRMPGLNGVEVAERIRGFKLKTQPALMMATAYVNEELVRKCEPLRLRDFLAKPYSPSALFNTVLAALGRAEADTPKADSLQPLAGLRVLVADDNEVNLEIASSILEHAGASVRLARNGEEVLEKLNSSEFNVALLDLQMPKLDGLEAARRLRADPRFATLPLVAMTAHAMPEHREASRLAGFDAHLLKPIDRRELFDTLLRYRSGAVPIQVVSSDALPTLDAPAAEQPREIAAIDRIGALARLGGNQNLLDRLLARFANDHADAAQLIVTALESGDLPRATREAHTLKGVASNLGATLLAATAGLIESELRLGKTPEPAVLDRLRVHQQETLRVIQQGDAAEPTPAQAAEPAREALLEQVLRLAALLSQHDADAKDAYNALQQRLPGALPPSALRLRAAVESYEFEAALLALQEVMRDLNLEGAVS